MPLDLEEQYDRIYRYCYFRLQNRYLAEDVTQEAFLRYLEHYQGLNGLPALKCLYTIAGNLCVDEFRRQKRDTREEALGEDAMEDRLLTNLAVRAALAGLPREDQALLLLRYVNEVPVSVIGKVLGMSRFAVYRKLKAASGRFRVALRRENVHE